MPPGPHAETVSVIHALLTKWYNGAQDVIVHCPPEQVPEAACPTLMFGHFSETVFI
jgi:hypothetical protein